MGGNFSRRMLVGSNEIFQSREKKFVGKKMKGKCQNFSCDRKELTHPISRSCYPYSWMLNYSSCPLLFPPCMTLQLRKLLFSITKFLTVHINQQNAFSYGKISTLYISESFSFIGLDIFGFHFPPLVFLCFSQIMNSPQR